MYMCTVDTGCAPQSRPRIITEKGIDVELGLARRGDTIMGDSRPPDHYQESTLGARFPHVGVRAVPKPLTPCLQNSASCHYCHQQPAWPYLTMRNAFFEGLGLKQTMRG